MKNVLTELAEAFDAQNNLIEEMKAASQAKDEQFRQGLLSLLNIYPSNDNGTPAVFEVAAIKPAAKPAPKSRQSSHDDALLDCLSTEWIKAGQIRKLLLARQIKISEGTVYNRMRKLAAERTNEIETATSPERWRLKAPKKGAEAANTPSLSPTKEERSKKAAQPNVTPLRGADVPAAARPATSLVPAAEIAPSATQGGATLYRGDCLEVMRQMPSGSVDLIFTSPPYNIGMTHSGRRQTLKKTKMWRSADFGQGYASYDDARDPAEYIAWQKEILRECWRLLSPKGAIFYQHKPRIQNKLMTTPLDYNPDLPLRQIVIWNRKGGNNFNQAFFVPAHEWIAVFAKPDFRLAKGGWNATDVWTINPERNNPHPAPFPVELPRTAIAATDADVIFDPFMGSGSTGVAAMQCGRKFIGIELEGSYLENARLRMEAEKSRLDDGGKEVMPAKIVARTKRKPAISANDNDAPVESAGTHLGAACLPQVILPNVEGHPEPRDNASAIADISSAPKMQTGDATIYQGDCLEVMKTLPDDSVDLILADLPYGTTGLNIDRPLPLDELWAEYRRIIKKPHGNIVLFGSQPFTSKLVNSAEDIFRHSLVWEKNKPTGFQHASAKPLKRHEDILVFSCGVNISEKRTKRRATYNPQGVIQVTKKAQGVSKVTYLSKAVRGHTAGADYVGLTNCPDDIIRIGKDKRVKGKETHPFAKPVALLEYLIRTYSNAGEVVLDNTMGSGSTGVAALNTGRQFIGIEMNAKWFDVARQRIETERSANGRATARIPCVPIAPIAQTSDSTIYQGDCLEVMRQLPSGSVDLVVTSPPYNLGLTKRSKPRSKKDSTWNNCKLYDGYGDYDDNMPHDEYVAWMRDVLSECWRLISDDGAIYFNHKPRIQKGKVWLPHELNPGLPLRQNIIWDRGQGFNFGSTFYTPSHEYIMMFAKPKFRLLKGKPLDVWSFGFARKNDHPAPFPVELPLRAIRHTNAKTILDPFMGSGTTGVAAKMMGRRFIGIDRYGEYVANAIERIESTERQSDNDNETDSVKGRRKRK
jgi:DNA modification methylase